MLSAKPTSLCSTSSAPWCPIMSAMMSAPLPHCRGARDEPHELASTGSCTASAHAQTAVRGTHSIMEARRGVTSHLARVAPTTGTPRPTQRAPTRRRSTSPHRPRAPTLQNGESAHAAVEAQHLGLVARAAQATCGIRWAGRRHRLAAPARPCRALASGRTAPKALFLRFRESGRKEMEPVHVSH